jgi:competence ComEA-like helix-hairpin-helix protein
MEFDASLEDELEEAHSRIHQLERELAAARAEIARLRGQAPARPPRPVSPPHGYPPPPQIAQEPQPREQPEEERSAHVEAAAERLDTRPRPRVPVWADPSPINVNTASLDDLMLLPGIGRKPAERIIAFREERGGLSSVDELYEIDEIPRERIARIQRHIRV